MISAGWNTVKEDYKFEAQEYFDCCTLNGPLTATNTSLLHCPKSVSGIHSPFALQTK